MELVKQEDVLTEQKNEFRPHDHIIDMLICVCDHMEEFLKGMGFKKFVFVHYKYGHDVNYFVKEDAVIMVDYHNSNTLIVDVLNKEEREWFVESVGRCLEPEETEHLYTIGNGGVLCWYQNIGDNNMIYDI